MREPTSIEFENSLAKSMPDFSLNWSRKNTEFQIQSLENDNVSFDTESRVIKKVVGKKKIIKQQPITNKTYKKSFLSKTKLDMDHPHLPMIRESTEIFDFSTEGTKFNLLRHQQSLKLPKLVPDTSLTEVSNDTSSLETESSLPEISLKRISNYIPTIHIDLDNNNPEKHYQSYSRFIHSFKNKYADTTSTNKSLDAMNKFKLEPLTGKLNKRFDSSKSNTIKFNKLFQ